MNTKDIGNIGEAKVLSTFVEMGIPVFVSFGDNNPADFVILVAGKPIKIQVKTSSTFDGNTIKFDLISSSTHRGNGHKHKYTIDEVDFFACYDTVNSTMFIVKNIGDMSAIVIRYSESKNRQSKGIRFYKDYLLTEDTLYRMIGS